ncbi:MAG TPA: hypothetical protein VLN41_02325 [Candidatus Bathyarchaeia archaeon]|nr:hypothetical protein [Candidatus Bathyarchaeia archaeon]
MAGKVLRAEDAPSRRLADPDDDPEWPVVSPNEIGVAEFDADLAYMGYFLKLEICNRSPYLVREATLHIEAQGPGMPGMETTRGVATTRDLTVGPLFPGAYYHEEIGIGARGGITGFSFDFAKPRAVKMTPPGQMIPASEYPALAAELIDAAVDEDPSDLYRPDDERPGSHAEAKVLRIRVRNAGPSTVDRVRLKLEYFDAGVPAGGASGPERRSVTEWILDMPRKDWNPYRLPAAPDAAFEPADPLPPDGSYEFDLVQDNGGPREWAGRLDATSIQVLELKLRQARP